MPAPRKTAKGRKRAEKPRKRGPQLLEAVNRISGLLHSTVDTAEVIQRMVDEGVVALGSDTAAVTERVDGGWLVRHIHGMPPELLGMELKDEQELHAVLALQTGDVLAIEDASNDERCNREHMQRWKVRSVLLAPLITRGRRFGMVFFNYHQATHAFTQEEISFARQLAASAASALENARLFDEQRRAEQETRRERDRLQALLNSIPDEVWFTDAESNLMLVNPAVRAEFGDSFVHGNMGAIAARAEVYRANGMPRPVEEAPPLRALHGEVIRGEEEIVRSPIRGELRHRQVNASPVRDAAGRVIGSVAVVRDITERKRDQDALRESERQYRALFQHMLEGLAYCRLLYDNGRPHDFVYVTVNEAFERLSGLKDAIGKKASDLIPGIHQSNPELLEIYGRVAATGQPERFETYVERLGIWFAVSVYRPQAEHFVAVFDNITERKRTEQSLRESEELFRIMFMESSVGQVQADVTTGRFLRTNPAFCRMTGYAEPELLGMTFSDITHPDDRVADRVRFHALVHGTAGSYTCEKRYVRKDGGVTWAQLTVNLVRDAQGKPLRSAAVIQDITERKQAEQERERLLAAVEEERARLQAIMKVLPVAVWVAATNGTMLMVNDAAVAMYGGKTPKVDGVDPYAVYKVWRPDTGEMVPAEDYPLSRALRGDTVTNQVVEVDHADGKRGTQLASAVPIRDAHGQVVGAVASAMDVTALKQTEAALRAANQRLAYHVQNTPLGVIEFDAELRVSAWSEGARRIFGWEAAEVLGRPMWEIPWICEEDRQKVQKVSDGLSSGATLRSVSPNRNLRKDGQVVWCEWYNSSLTDATGKMQSIQALVLEVTARKLAEAVLARDKEQLEQLVAERTARLQELVNELEHFSYTITHDMRAPLRAMRGIAEILNENDGEWTDEDRQKFLRRIIVAAERMDSLITDALNYSKAVKQELPLAPVDPGKLLRGMLETYPEFQGADADIQLEGNLPLVMGNEAGLTQCFSNLLTNAVKFAKPGVRPVVRVHGEGLAGDGRGWARLWVEDNGVGISEGMKPRVFDMFSRGAHAKAGTGIGLALVRKVVDRMGGRVGVESTEGKGSRFWVQLRSATPP